MNVVMCWRFVCHGGVQKHGNHGCCVALPIHLFDYAEWGCSVEDLSFDEDAIDAITKAVTNKTSSHYAAKDKYLRLPISEVIDAARCEKLSVSYVQVPEDYPKLTFSARYAFLSC